MVIVEERFIFENSYPGLIECNSWNRRAIQQACEALGGSSARVKAKYQIIAERAEADREYSKEISSLVSQLSGRIVPMLMSMIPSLTLIWVSTEAMPRMQLQATSSLMVFLPRILSMVNWSMNSYSNTAISMSRMYVSFSLSFLQLLNVNRAVTMTNQNHTSIRPSLNDSALFSLPPFLLSQSNIPTASNLMTGRLSSSCHQWWHLRPPRCIIISSMFCL